MFTISRVHARQILDSRGTPTIEVDLYLNDDSMGRAAIPSGASTGTHEALELRDGDKSHFLGKGVLTAVKNVNEKLNAELAGKQFASQEELDTFMLELDGTANKSGLGANAILGVSMAFAHAVAKSKGVQLFEHVKDVYGASEYKLPRPMFNIMNGGKHADWSTDIQEFMVVIQNRDYPEMLRAGAEIFLHLGKLLEKKGLSTNIGNEGGYAPGFANNEEAFSVISEAIALAGYELGKDVFFALDVASSEFYNAETHTYDLKTEKRSLTPKEWMSLIESWMEKYPFVSIEDPFSEDDWASWVEFTARNGEKVQIVGDDLLVTNIERVQKAIEMKACNALLVKVNQIGSLTETFKAMHMAESAGWNNVVSHRSGETEDVSISHIAVGTAAGQIKTGAPSRGERTAKYNELLRIAEVI